MDQPAAIKNGLAWTWQYKHPLHEDTTGSEIGDLPKLNVHTATTGVRMEPMHVKDVVACRHDKMYDDMNHRSKQPCKRAMTNLSLSSELLQPQTAKPIS